MRSKKNKLEGTSMSNRVGKRDLTKIIQGVDLENIEDIEISQNFYGKERVKIYITQELKPPVKTEKHQRWNSRVMP